MYISTVREGIGIVSLLLKHKLPLTSVNTIVVLELESESSCMETMRDRVISARIPFTEILRPRMVIGLLRLDTGIVVILLTCTVPRQTTVRSVQVMPLPIASLIDRYSRW